MTDVTQGQDWRENLVPCWDCQGTGKAYIGGECMRCKGTGEVKAIMLFWMKEGHRMARERTNYCLTLKDEADRRGINVQELSDMERGIIEPKWAEGA